MKRWILFIAMLTASVAWTMPLHAQEAKVNQKKIDKERRQKQKAAEKEYEARKKRHLQLQTKETRARMRQSKKEARKVTPIRP